MTLPLTTPHPGHHGPDTRRSGFLRTVGTRQTQETQGGSGALSTRRHHELEQWWPRGGMLSCPGFRRTRTVPEHHRPDPVLPIARGGKTGPSAGHEVPTASAVKLHRPVASDVHRRIVHTAIHSPVHTSLHVHAHSYPQWPVDSVSLCVLAKRTRELCSDLQL